MLAEIAHDLEQALLFGSGFENTCTGVVQEALASQAQHGVIFRLWPFEEASLGELFQFYVFAGVRARPKPRQNDIDGEISGALFA